jgi:hypothetical protein
VLREPRALSIRIHENVQRERISVLYNGETVKPMIVDNYLHVSNTRKWGRVRVELPSVSVDETFLLNGKEYRGTWVGEMLAHLSGPKVFFREIYG